MPTYCGVAMAMVLIVAIVAVLLLFGTTIQSTYPDDPRVRSKQFKVGLMFVALLAGILLLVSSVQNERAQNELRESVAGVSQTIFDRDMKLAMAITYESAGQPVGLVDQPFVILTIIPPESTEFCKVGVTHTPVRDSIVGQLFTTLDPAPNSSGGLAGFDDPTAQQFTFQFLARNTGDIVELSQEADPLPLVAGRRMSMDELEESQFIVEVLIPGTILKIHQLTLYVKGKPIPFEVVRVGDKLYGSTVFRPTYESRCRPKLKSDLHEPATLLERNTP